MGSARARASDETWPCATEPGAGTGRGDGAQAQGAGTGRRHRAQPALRERGSARPTRGPRGRLRPEDAGPSGPRRAEAFEKPRPPRGGCRWGEEGSSAPSSPATSLRPGTARGGGQGARLPGARSPRPGAPGARQRCGGGEECGLPRAAGLPWAVPRSAGARAAFATSTPSLPSAGCARGRPRLPTPRPS